MLWPDNHLYEFGPFVLDARSRILLREGVTVHLTPKAFETLLVLIQSGVQVVEKEKLLKEVWPDTFVEEGSLSRNIHELRKALGDDSSEPRYIQTIPKRGYRFLAPLKVAVLDDGRTGHTSLGGETTVIEKHTFARVLSEEFEGSDLPVEERFDDTSAALAGPLHAGKHQRQRQGADQAQAHAEHDLRLDRPIGCLGAPHRSDA